MYFTITSRKVSDVVVGGLKEVFKGVSRAQRDDSEGKEVSPFSVVLWVPNMRGCVFEKREYTFTPTAKAAAHLDSTLDSTCVAHPLFWDYTDDFATEFDWESLRPLLSTADYETIIKKDWGSWGTHFGFDDMIQYARQCVMSRRIDDLMHKLCECTVEEEEGAAKRVRE